MAENNNKGKSFPAKPFLKWAGSKRQLLPQFHAIYPAALKAGGIMQYHEPFVGSGAVFFDIAQRYPLKEAFLCDINEALVLTYRVLQEHVLQLIEVLYTHQRKYLALDNTGRLAYYYEQRAAFNALQGNNKYSRKYADAVIARAALLIFLNRTCYNGLFRVNSKGWFNTPAGRYADPCICDEANLLAVSRLLSVATIQKANFTQALKRVRPGAFVYLDPPYRPMSATAYFTSYSRFAFADAEQVQLAQACRTLHEKGALIMLSNADTLDGFFDDLYLGFHIARVPARRLINANASGRGAVNEIVVTNYPV